VPDDGAAVELDGMAAAVRGELDAVHAAREAGLAACRRTIRLAGSAIRAVHRHQPERAADLTSQSAAALQEAQAALLDYPMVAHAGFLFDAEKEYAEAVLTSALVAGEPLAQAWALRVGLAAWLNGMAEAASELRRHLLDLLRHGRLDEAETILGAMDDIYDLLVGVDYPDAVTGGLRRRTDALRAVLERTRSDLTTTTLQYRLQAALERRAGTSEAAGGALP
jgi:translin